MNPYTAVCIGGSADGAVLTVDHREVFVRVPEPLTSFIADPEPLIHRTMRTDRYRAERFAISDGKPPIYVLVHEDLTIRQAFDQMVDAYTGCHAPKHSSKQAEPSEVEVLMRKIRTLEVMVRCSLTVIRKLRKEAE